MAGLNNNQNKFNFKKSLGQNFLQDKNIINGIVNKSNIIDNSLIIEVGPGNGALTKELIKTNNNILCFEIDKTLEPELSKLNYSNLKIVYEDFLKIDLKKYISNYKYNKLYVIANLPYYITTPIINKIIDETDVDFMSLMMQKEVGDRLKAKPNTKEYNSLSVFVQYYFDIEKILDVSRNCFYPRPNVDSIVLKFSRRDYPIKVKDESFFFKFVQDCFKLKRKNLRNNLKSYNLDKIEEILKSFNKNLTYRAEQLTIDEFIEISNNLC